MKAVTKVRFAITTIFALIAVAFVFAGYGEDVEKNQRPGCKVNEPRIAE